MRRRDFRVFTLSGLMFTSCGTPTPWPYTASPDSPRKPSSFREGERGKCLQKSGSTVHRRGRAAGFTPADADLAHLSPPSCRNPARLTHPRLLIRFGRTAMDM